jgi:metallo-beta-lactamase family protein
MSFELRFLGATGQVTGSLYEITAGSKKLLIECGLVQGQREDETRNRTPFPFDPAGIDAVVLSHAHIDHSGRLPKLAREGFAGPVYTHAASRALCDIMLADAGDLNEKEAERENRKYHGGSPVVKPLYTRADAESCLRQFVALDYDTPTGIAAGVQLTLHDAGHILGSSIVELSCDVDGSRRTLVFSGDLGYRDAPLMRPASKLAHADAVLMESTYGDRLHRPIAATLAELGRVFAGARAARGNILIPAFTVGRTQDLLQLMSQNYERWGLADWHIFLDSPMGIEATSVYAHFQQLYDGPLFGVTGDSHGLPNLHATQTVDDSRAINDIEAGAIIIAGSGMCTGGRILHHLKHNVWRSQCHVIIVGYQAEGTLGRRLVDGAREITLLGETLGVHATVHTIGGLSAHADQEDLADWYSAFDNKPPLYLVHGEERAALPLQERLGREPGTRVTIPRHGQVIRIGA